MKRGNLLWTGSRMMLAEHRQMLNKRLKEEQIESDVYQEIDEQLLEEWQEIWGEAANNNCKVVVTYNKYKRNEISGYIVNWSFEDGSVYLQVNDKERVKISINDIVAFKLGDR